MDVLFILIEVLTGVVGTKITVLAICYRSCSTIFQTEFYLKLLGLVTTQAIRGRIIIVWFQVQRQLTFEIYVDKVTISGGFSRFLRFDENRDFALFHIRPPSYEL